MLICEACSEGLSGPDMSARFTQEQTVDVWGDQMREGEATCVSCGDYAVFCDYCDDHFCEEHRHLGGHEAREVTGLAFSNIEWVSEKPS